MSPPAKPSKPYKTNIHRIAAIWAKPSSRKNSGAAAASDPSAPALAWPRASVQIEGAAVVFTTAGKPCTTTGIAVPTLAPTAILAVSSLCEGTADAAAHFFFACRFLVLQRDLYFTACLLQSQEVCNTVFFRTDSLF